MASTAERPAAAVLGPLDRLRRALVRYVLWDGLAALVFGLAVWFWAGLALDYGLFRLTGFDWVERAPGWVRWLVPATLAAVVAAAAWRAGRRLWGEVSYQALALAVERRFPNELGDRVITAVELADAEAQARVGYSPAMLRQTAAEAGERLARVPVERVLDWRRLRVRAARAAAALLAPLLGLAAVAAARPGVGAAAAVLTAEQWGGRNLLLEDARWPRRAHLEYVGRHPEREVRIGRDAPAPKVAVRAYEWVSADPTLPAGWAPLMWYEVVNLFPRDAVPAAVPVPTQNLLRAAVAGGPAVRDARFSAGGRPEDWVYANDYERPLGNLTADEAFERYGDRPEFADVRGRLEALAADPWQARRLRRLARPAGVTLSYIGRPTDGRPSATAGSVRLVRQPDGTHAGEVAGLRESVRLSVRAEDFRTPPVDVVLIPPPQLVRLARTELRPAYHTARPAAADLPALKGLQQTAGERELSLTGDRTVLTVPAGTVVTLIGTADKPLATVTLTRKGGGSITRDAGESFRVPLFGPHGGDRFGGPGGGLAAPQDDQPKAAEPPPDDGRLAASAEYELTLSDADRVTTTRSILVQVTPDQPPQVEAAFDVLRKVGANYLCTPAARAAVGKDSIVRDDAGLSAVRWRFVATRLESPAAAGLALQLQALGGAATAGTLARGARQAAELPVPAFDRLDARIPRDTLAVAKDKLTRPPADPDAAPAVREVRFSPDADAFDLLDAGTALERAAVAAGRSPVPLRVTDPNAVQPRYQVEASLTATDTDVDAGPKTGQPLEPLRLLVVSEADLLAEITRDEDQQAAKLDEAVRRVREAEAKLSQQAERLAPADPPAEVKLAARVRAEDITQDVGKARELTLAVVGEYGRLRREVEANRCGLEPDDTGRQVSKVAVRYDAVVIRPLEAVVTGEFAAADEGLAAVRDALAADRRPADAVMGDARSRLAALALKLAGVRAALGEALSEKKLRDELQRLIARQLELSSALAGLKERMVKALFAPKLAAVPPVEATRGKPVTVRHAIDWNVYDQGELAVRFEYPAGGVSGPATVAVKDDRTELEYVLTAGDAAGEYTVRVVPAVGEPVEVKVTVK
jgi:hypothetical protein